MEHVRISPGKAFRAGADSLRCSLPEAGSPTQVVPRKKYPRLSCPAFLSPADVSHRGKYCGGQRTTEPGGEAGPVPLPLGAQRAAGKEGGWTGGEFIALLVSPTYFFLPDIAPAYPSRKDHASPLRDCQVCMHPALLEGRRAELLLLCFCFLSVHPHPNVRRVPLQ